MDTEMIFPLAKQWGPLKRTITEIEDNDKGGIDDFGELR